MKRTRSAAGAPAAFALVAAVTLSLGAAGGGRSRPAPDCAADRVRIGDIVGMQVFFGSDRLYLLATPPSDQLEVELRRDHVVQLAMAVACCHGFGFSLDLHRSGTRRFTPSDLRDPEGLARRLAGADTPLAAYLRALVRPQALARGKPDGDKARELVRLSRVLADALNAARTDPALYSPTRFPTSGISSEARALLDAGARDREARLRFHRLLLEDAFPVELRQDVDRYEIRYKPAKNEAPLRSILDSTLVEQALLSTDSAFKAMSYGTGLPRDLALGGSEVYFCSAELEEPGERDSDRAAPGYGRSHTYFELQARAQISYPVESVALAFPSPLILARAVGDTAESRPAECTRRFIESLNANLPSLMNHDSALGNDFRLLRTLLLLQRGLVWAQDRQGVEFDVRRLREVPTERVANTPPQLREFPTISVDWDGKVVGQLITGGIEFAADGPAGNGLRGHAVARPAPRSETDQPPPCFSVVPGSFDGREVLRIDLSAILGIR